MVLNRQFELVEETQARVNGSRFHPFGNRSLSVPQGEHGPSYLC